MNKSEKFFLRGMSSKHLNKYSEAKEDFDKAIALDSNYVDAWFERGKCFVRLKKFPQAVKNFGKAIELEPKHTAAYLERGKCFERMKKFFAAVRDFSKVIEIFPDPLDDDYDKAILSAEAYYRRAGVYERLGDFDAAEKDHFQSMSNYVASMMFYMSADEQIELIFGDEKPPEPSEEENIADKWQWLALGNLKHGKCSYCLDEFESALDDFNRVIESVPTLENFFDMKIYEGSNEVLVEQAEEYFTGIFDKNKNPNRMLLAMAYVGRGLCRQKLGEEEKSQADFAKAAEIESCARKISNLKDAFVEWKK